MTRWHAAGRHLAASMMLYGGAMSLHPIFFYIFTGCLVAAVFATGMEGRDG